MYLVEYRNRAHVAATMDLVLSLLAIFAVIAWVEFSCESYDPRYAPQEGTDTGSSPSASPTEPPPENHSNYSGILTRGRGGGRAYHSTSSSSKNSKRTNFSACHDARNTSGLQFGENTMAVLIGSFFRVAVIHREYATGEEMERYQWADFILNFVQAFAAICFVAKEKGRVETRKRELIRSGIYLLCSTLTGGGTALWRLSERVWLGFVVGAAIRSSMTVVVGQFFFQLVSSSRLGVKEIDSPGDLGDGQRNGESMTVVVADNVEKAEEGRHRVKVNFLKVQ